ncbi:M15 family metallopeptidase [Pseudocolwellia sp. HL-MZ19]|uniref:M15 family metallopeptidase n=1 Tax=unclassified Pseudocolwellia TaxID=2848178 RepID=UPI003CE75A6F
MSLDHQQLCGLNDSHIIWLSDNLGIHKEMQLAWQSLSDAALAKGFDLKIASGYRSFDRQLSIWNRKFKGELATRNKNNEIVNLSQLSDDEKVDAILTYSALPGTSRHHWGTDIDIYAENLLLADKKLQLEPWEYQQGGPFEPLSLWIEEYAKSFGFFLPYDKDRGGVAIEPWHLSYAPLAQPCLCDISIETLAQTIQQADILGKQAILNKLPTIFSQYVQNINKGT